MPRSHFRTIDVGAKLASVISIPSINDVPTMDKLTDRELNRLIIQEPDPGENEQLSHVLSLIFRTFTAKIPAVDQLKVPLHKIRHVNAGITRKFLNQGEDELVPLYDTGARCWNWGLPTRHQRVSKSPAKSAHVGEEQEGLEDAEEKDLVTNTATDEIIFASFLNTLTAALVKANDELTSMHPGVMRTWSAANSMRPVPDDEIRRKPDLALLDDVEARWDTIKVICELTSQKYTPASTIAKTIDSKAYLLFRRQPWRRFVLLFSVCNGYRELRVHLYDHLGGVVTPSISIDRDPDRFLHTLACVVFGSLDCLGYDPTITIHTKTLQPAQREQWSTAFVRPAPDTTPTLDTEIESIASASALITDNTSHAPPLIESAPPAAPSQHLGDLPTPLPEDPLHAPLSQPIGKIRVNHNQYDILEVLFSSQGLVGRGTVCYRTLKDGQEFIIKDHWVLGGKDTVLNEVTMMQKMKGVRGVPELTEYWLVEIAPGEVDESEKYRYHTPPSIIGTFRTHVRLVLRPRARPLHMFRTKLELVGAIRDIVKSKHTLGDLDA